MRSSLAAAVAVGCEPRPGCVFEPELVAEPVGEVAIDQQGEREERGEGREMEKEGQVRGSEREKR